MKPWALLFLPAPQSHCTCRQLFLTAKVYCPQIRPVGSSPDIRASTGPFLVWSLMSLPFPTALPWPGLEWAHLPDSCLLFALTLLTCLAQLSWPICTCWPSVCPWCLVTISNLDFLFSLSFLLFNLKVNPCNFNNTPKWKLPLSIPIPESTVNSHFLPDDFLCLYKHTLVCILEQNGYEYGVGQKKVCSCLYGK